MKVSLYNTAMIVLTLFYYKIFALLEFNEVSCELLYFEVEFCNKSGNKKF
jgi:hypothetical protein